MGKIIGIIVVIVAIVAGAWLYISSIQSSEGTSSTTVTEPIDEARDLEDRATAPRIDQTAE